MPEEGWVFIFYQTTSPDGRCFGVRKLMGDIWSAWDPTTSLSFTRLIARPLEAKTYY